MLSVFLREPLERVLVRFNGEGLKVRLQSAPGFGQKNMLLAPVPRFNLPGDDALLFQLGQSRVNCRFGQVRTFTQFALGKTFFSPQDPKENPLSKGYSVISQPSCKRAVESPCRQPRQMRDPFVWVVAARNAIQAFRLRHVCILIQRSMVGFTLRRASWNIAALDQRRN
jgi:hypothetical protein